MRVWVPALPRVELNVVGSSRERAEYMAAHEELKAEVATELPTIARPFKRAHISVVAFVGHGKTGFYRPVSGITLQPAVDAVYRALIDQNYIEGVQSVPVVTTGVIQGADEEGLQITIEELEESSE